MCSMHFDGRVKPLNRTEVVYVAREAVPLVPPMSLTPSGVSAPYCADVPIAYNGDRKCGLENHGSPE